MPELVPNRESPASPHCDEFAVWWENSVSVTTTTLEASSLASRVTMGKSAAIRHFHRNKDRAIIPPRMMRNTHAPTEGAMEFAPRSASKARSATPARSGRKLGTLISGTAPIPGT